MRKWETLTELAELIIARSRAGKPVTLAPDTAFLVGLKLMTADAKPSHHDIIAEICDSKCASPCIPCTFKANAIVRIYGQGRNATRNAQ